MADQQYCLRWNNHQTTLISVFESLQERGCMVDCTLAAEGQSLQAHKVVLSACSPYLEDLLSKHYDKHPILLLKDVKFEELKAMMDYMYRGEVNVAQDKLNTFLRAAESLQIKGLSDGGTDPPDSGGTGSMKRTAKGAPVSVRSNQQLTVRTTNLADDNSSRDGSVSPSLRKRRRRRGSDGSDHDNSSNVADGKQSSAAAAPVTGPTVINEDMLPTVPASGPSDDNLLSSILESTETENATDSGITSANNTVPLQENVIRDRDNVLIEPKTEYLDDDAQDLHLDDDDSMFRAGPSHARGSGNYEGDDGEDVYMANQDSGANAQETDYVSEEEQSGAEAGGSYEDYFEDHDGEGHDGEMWTTEEEEEDEEEEDEEDEELRRDALYVPGSERPVRAPTAPRSYLCHACDEIFVGKGPLLEHNQWTHKEVGYHCRGCEGVFRSNALLHLHMKGRHPHMTDKPRALQPPPSPPSPPTSQVLPAGARPDEIVAVAMDESSQAYCPQGPWMEGFSESSATVCLSCDETLVGEAAVQEHDATHHSGRSSHICPHPRCSRRFDRNQQVQQHVVAEHRWSENQLLPDKPDPTPVSEAEPPAEPPAEPLLVRARIRERLAQVLGSAP